MDDILNTAAGVHDVVHFFHGDGPAAQFEASHKQEGNYCCDGCAAHSSRFTDIAYCYRAPKPTLQERQEYFLQERQEFVLQEFVRQVDPPTQSRYYHLNSS